MVPAVADGSCYVGVTLEENARKAIADGSTSPSSTPPRARASCRTARPSSAAARTRKTRGKFIDFLLSPDVQQLLGTELSRRSVRTDTASDALPELTVLPYDLRRADERRQELFDAWQALCGEVEA